MEGVFRLGCLCRMVGFFLNDPDGGMPFAEEAEDYEGVERILRPRKK